MARPFFMAGVAAGKRRIRENQAAEAKRGGPFPCDRDLWSLSLAGPD